MRHSASAAGDARSTLETDMTTATSVHGYKRPWLRFLNCTPSNKALKLTRSAMAVVSAALAA